MLILAVNSKDSTVTKTELKKAVGKIERKNYDNAEHYISTLIKIIKKERVIA